MKTKIRKETIEIDLEDIISDSGKLYSNLSKEGLLDILTSEIELRHNKTLEQASKDDKIFDFYNFKIDLNKLKKYSESSNIYPHFVYFHLQNYHTNSVGSRHSYNGGNWCYYAYDPSLMWHKKMIEDMNLKNDQTNHNFCSIKNSVLFHFYSGGIIRIYGVPMNYKTIRNFKNTEDRIKFFDYILDSGMININKKEKISCEVEKTKYFNSEYGTFGESALHHCIRNKDLDCFKYLVEKKGLDLYQVDKAPYVKGFSKEHGIFYYGHNTSILYRLIDDICGSNYEYEFNNKNKKTISFFKELFSYINKKFPQLKIYDNKSTIGKKSGVKEVLSRSFGGNSSRYNDKQIEFLQTIFF